MSYTTINKKVINISVNKSNLTTDNIGNKYLKIDYFMFIENNKLIPDYTKVFKDNILMTFGVDWEWGNVTAGNDYTLRDNIHIKNLTGSIYRLQYIESFESTLPNLRFWDSEGRRNKIITSRINLGVWENIQSIIQRDNFDYSVIYEDELHMYGHEIRKTYSRYTRLLEYPVNYDLSALNLKIEVMHSGTKSGGCNNTPGFNSNLNPYASYTTNLIPNPSYKGNFFIRIRNIKTNLLTDFSKRTLSIRRYGVWKRQSSGDTFIGYYLMPKLV